MGKFLSEEQEYQQQKQQVDVYNRSYQNMDEDVEMGYLDMNSRMLELEKSQQIYKDDAEKWKKREEEHDLKKKKIESKWHSMNPNRVLEITNKAKGDDKDAKYYKDFSLSQLEILIKNSDRNEGKKKNKNKEEDENKDKNTIWNSNEFNDVATDLELLNRVGEDWNVAERYQLLSRLSQTSKKYVDKRHPLSKIGRRRKAMITALNTKVKSEMESIMTKIKKASDSASEEIENIGNEITQENQATLEKACKAKFDLASIYLQGNIELEDKQVQKLDTDLTTIMEKLLKYGVDDNQANNISTRFMNAIGWSARKPKLMNYVRINEGQIRIPLYHTINSLSNDQTAEQMVDQLKGKGEKTRQFLSDGFCTKGTYTAARNVQYEDSDNMSNHDKFASKNSWLYGKNDGSMQVEAIFNEKARIIDAPNFKYVNELFSEKFSKFSSFLTTQDLGGQIENNKYGNQVVPRSGNIVLSFYGYNTVRVPKAVNDEYLLDYYVTWDRSAFTMEDVMTHMRQNGKPVDRNQRQSNRL